MKNKKIIVPPVMAENETQSRIIYPHGTPMTRRDMLKAGVIQFTAAMTLPTVYEWLARAGLAEAAEIVGCDSGSGFKMPVFISLSLAGGAAMSSNWVPGDAGGALLPSYSSMGLGSNISARTTTEFANKARFSTTSGILAGVRTGAPVTTLNKAVFVGIPVRSQDDSNMNKFDITGAVTRAGFKGNSLPNLGNVGSATGGRHQPAYVPPPAPLIVTSYNDIASAINVAGSLAALSTNQKLGVFKLVNRLTASQSATLAGMSGGEQVAQLTQCATGINSGLVSSGSTGTSPLDMGTFATLWNINAGTAKNSTNFVFASMLYNALKGNSGTCNLTMGGFDYHGNDRNNTNAQDQSAGLVIGRILQSAQLMNQKLFLMVSSDGSVSSPASDVGGNGFSSDNGSKGSCYAIFFDPAKVPKATGSQIGQFTASGQAADDKFITGDSPSLAAAAVLANYMSVAGRINDFDSVIPRVFSPEQMTLILKMSA